MGGSESDAPMPWRRSLLCWRQLAITGPGRQLHRRVAAGFSGTGRLLLGTGSTAFGFWGTWKADAIHERHHLPQASSTLPMTEAIAKVAPSTVQIRVEFSKQFTYPAYSQTNTLA